MAHRRRYRKRSKYGRAIRVLVLFLLFPIVLLVDLIFTRQPRASQRESYYVPAELASMGLQATGLPSPPWELPYSELLALDLGTRMGWPGGGMEMWLPVRAPADENDAGIWGDEALFEYTPPAVGIYHGPYPTPPGPMPVAPPEDHQSPIGNWASLGSTGLSGFTPWEVHPLYQPPPVVHPAD